MTASRRQTLKDTRAPVDPILETTSPMVVVVTTESRRSARAQPGRRLAARPAPPCSSPCSWRSWPRARPAASRGGARPRRLHDLDVATGLDQPWDLGFTSGSRRRVDGVHRARRPRLGDAAVGGRAGRARPARVRRSSAPAKAGCSGSRSTPEFAVNRSCTPATRRSATCGCRGTPSTRSHPAASCSTPQRGHRHAGEPERAPLRLPPPVPAHHQPAAALRRHRRQRERRLHPAEPHLARRQGALRRCATAPLCPANPGHRRSRHRRPDPLLGPPQRAGHRVHGRTGAATASSTAPAATTRSTCSSRATSAGTPTRPGPAPPTTSRSP